MSQNKSEEKVELNTLLIKEDIYNEELVVKQSEQVPQLTVLEENVKDEDEEGRQTHDFEVTRDAGETTIGERINENTN